MASTAPCTSVLRIGPSDENASAALLRTALLSRFETEDDPNAMTVSNRYFSAQVRLEDIQHAENCQKKEDGIILVFDALRSNPDITGSTSSSFDALTIVHNQAQEANQCGELLRLCVGVSIGEKTPSQLRGGKHEDEYSRRVLWCLDRGYEYVEADLSEEGQLAGHDERDKEGFARIVEAVSGTVWSSAVMGASKQNQLKQSYEKEKEPLNEAKEENPYIPPDPSLLASETLQTSVGSIEEATKNIQASLVEVSKSDEGLIDGEQTMEQDRVMENLEGVLREATRIREASKNGQLSDDERRQRATDAAVLMMGLMNDLDVGDDSEIDSSDDEN